MDPKALREAVESAVAELCRKIDMDILLYGSAELVVERKVDLRVADPWLGGW